MTYLVNSRPLYPSSDEIWESPPITPNDLLIGHHFPPPVPEQDQRVNPRHLMRSTEKRVQIKIPEAWMPTIKKHNRRMVQQRTAEGATSRRNSEDQNAPIIADHAS